MSAEPFSWDPPVASFTGQYEFLSNFSPDPVELPWQQGLIFRTAEHAFQACKSENEADVIRIHAASTPYRAKQLGRQVTLRPDWEQVKRRMMTEVLLAKFGGNRELTTLLTATGRMVLVEGNTWGDDYWGAVPYELGVPVPPALPFWTSPGTVRLAGQNWLGRILMMVRELLL